MKSGEEKDAIEGINVWFFGFFKGLGFNLDVTMVRFLSEGKTTQTAFLDLNLDSPFLAYRGITGIL